MENSEFKHIFNEIARNYGFEKAYEGWFKEFPEVIQVLELQKSNYGNYYYLNIKLFIQGVFGNKHVRNKKLVKTDIGNISIRQPDEYSKYLNLETLDASQIKEGLNNLFKQFIAPFSENTHSRETIINLHREGELHILTAVGKELGIEC